MHVEVDASKLGDIVAANPALTVHVEVDASKLGDIVAPNPAFVPSY